MYTVFYHEAENGFFQLKTDYPAIEEAEMFIQSDYFRSGHYKFLFLLQGGSTLIKGTPIENSKEHFSKAMQFALDIPRSKYTF